MEGGIFCVYRGAANSMHFLVPGANLQGNELEGPHFVLYRGV